MSKLTFEHDLEGQGVVEWAITAVVVVAAHPWNATSSRRAGCQRTKHSIGGLVVRLLLSSALIVSNINSVALPSDFVLLSLLDRVDQWLHAHVVVGVRLHEVDDVEAVHFIFLCVLHSEVVPLRVALGSVVVLQVEVILGVADLDSLAQVPAFEATLKDECVISLSAAIFELVKRF